MEETKDAKVCKMCGQGNCSCGKSCCGDSMCCGHKKYWGYKGKSGMGGFASCLAFIGALVYFMQSVTTFGGGVMALLKSIVWPAILVYKLLVFLVA